MRQFVLGLLVVGFVWWGWSSWFSTPANGAVDPAGSGSAAPVGGQPQLDLGSLLAASGGEKPPPEPAGEGHGGRGALAARGSVDPTPGSEPALDVEGLLGRIAGRNPMATNEGWAALASGRLGAARTRVAAALQPATDDFRGMLAALGSDNGFLHSPEGRAVAQKVMTAALNMADAEAVPAGSQMLGLCLRGRIDRRDTDARAFVDEAYRQHLVRVDRWLCDPGNVARSRSYTVVRGDSLGAIAGRFRREGTIVEDGTLAVLNRIHNPNALQAGQKIKVPMEPIVAVVEKRSFSLSVYVGEYMLRLYWVGHGENDKTPVTEFTVAEKQPRPDWTSPDGKLHPYGDPKNILGEYFIKFRHERYTGFGAHGTPMPETICTMSSMGCIRMLSPDIADLFRLLPRGAKVQVRCSESVR